MKGGGFVKTKRALRGKQRSRKSNVFRHKEKIAGCCDIVMLLAACKYSHRRG